MYIVLIFKEKKQQVEQNYEILSLKWQIFNSSNNNIVM